MNIERSTVIIAIVSVCSLLVSIFTYYSISGYNENNIIIEAKKQAVTLVSAFYYSQDPYAKSCIKAVATRLNRKQIHELAVDIDCFEEKYPSLKDEVMNDVNMKYCINGNDFNWSYVYKKIENVMNRYDLIYSAVNVGVADKGVVKLMFSGVRENKDDPSLFFACSTKKYNEYDYKSILQYFSNKNNNLELDKFCDEVFNAVDNKKCS